MNKEEIKLKMEALSAKMKELGEKTKDSVDTAKIKGMYAKDKIDEMVSETKSNVNAMKENYDNITSFSFTDNFNNRIVSSFIFQNKENFDYKTL